MSDRSSGSQEDLICYLEELSGRQIRTREDVRALMQESFARTADGQPSRRWRSMKHAVLGLLLTFTALQYYFLDVLLQILSLRELTHFTPAVAKIVTSML